MTALDEIKESTKDSLVTKQQALSDLIDEHPEDDAEVRDGILDIIGEALALYKMTVAQARIAKSVDEVAELWRDMHLLYAGMLSLWQGLDTLGGGEPRDELFEYCKATIQKLERASAQAYKFHA
ncbi:MAG TPA: hypothetical protein VE860_18845 [Chthoniobacterales bacterium]|jgi:hypothetical protein|nr:hypothetical protein [Chthoniobacterales bacterium]